jgi:hypothetical protein
LGPSGDHLKPNEVRYGTVNVMTKALTRVNRGWLMFMIYKPRKRANLGKPSATEPVGGRRRHVSYALLKFFVVRHNPDDLKKPERIELVCGFILHEQKRAYNKQ